MINWFKRIGLKFANAIKGIVVMVKEERSLWVHLFTSVVVIIAGILLFDTGAKADGDAAWQWASIISCITIVIAFEIVNTAIEHMIDIIYFEYNIKAKKVKDIAATATLVVTIGAVIIGLIVFVPELIELFNPTTIEATRIFVSSL